MRIPIESSELDQIVRETPSHVGSCVLVIDLSSMVLKIEHIVALQNVSGGHIASGRFRLRNTEQEDNANTPLSSLAQLDARKIDERCSHVDYICDDVADTLKVG